MTDGKVGVFICDCGGEISTVLNTQVLREQASALPGVSVACTLRYCCSPDGLAAVAATIRELGLERLVIAGCTPRTMAPLFRAACERAGVIPDRLELVDVREACAWVHADEPAAAAAKALDLLRMGVASLVQQEPRTTASAAIIPSALVIGGGLAGLTAAETLATSGMPVKLVERETTLGGMLRTTAALSPGGYDAAEMLADRVGAVMRSPEVEVFLGSRVTAVTGAPGCYHVTLSAPEGGAASVRGSTAVTSQPTFDVGAIVVATGAQFQKPHRRYGYDGQRVITQAEFDRELQQAARDSRADESQVRRDASAHAEALGDVVMLLCAGEKGEHLGSCGGLCCAAALQQAMQVKALEPESEVTILYRELCLPDGGAGTADLDRALKAGVRFIHYSPQRPPQVAADAVQVQDAALGTSYYLPCRSVVLALPLLPQQDAGVVAHMLHIAQDQNGFFPQVRYRLRPQSYVERGIYVCGAAHHPADWRETEFQAMDAAFGALRRLQAERVVSLAPIAVVDERLCTGCGNCVSACSFAAMAMNKGAGVLDISRIDPLLCVGCGNCAVTCPTKAIRLSQSSDSQVLAQIDAALEDRAADGRLRVLVMACEWSGFAAAELAGARKLSYPVEVRPLCIRCSARCDPLHILWAFLRGADGVLLAACAPGDCHYISGNRSAQDRIAVLSTLLAESGFDPRRLRLEWITPDDPDDFVGKVTAFVQLIRALR